MGSARNVVADVCVVGLGPGGRAIASRAVQAGLSVVAIDPQPNRVWYPTYSCWLDELPGLLPDTVIAARIEKPTVWARDEQRVERPYCVLSKPGLRDALPLDGARVVAGRAANLMSNGIELTDGRTIAATTVFDTRGLPHPRRRPAASAFGITVDADLARRYLADGECVLLDWRDENGASRGAPPSFLYAVPLGGGTVLFEETSLGVPGGLPRRELRTRALHRLARHGIRPQADARQEAAHYPLDQRPPRRSRADNRPVPFGARGGMVHPCTGYSVAASLRRADTAIAALLAGDDPVKALWPAEARMVHWLRRRGMNGLGRLTAEQSAALFQTFFTASTERQRALLSNDSDVLTLGATLVSTVARTWPFRWRYDMVGVTNRGRWALR